MAAATSSIPLFCMLSLFALFAAVCSAGQEASPPAVDCTSLVLNMADCLSFVTAGSTIKKPEGTCCSGLKTVLKTDADCLCETFKNSAQLGVTLDVKKAFTLPAACHVSAPSVSNCGLSNDTGAAPALSPLGLSPSSVAGTPSPSVGANEVAPAPAPPSSSSSTVASSILLVVLSTIAAVPLALF